MSEFERKSHYRELAAQYREWAAIDTNPEARDGLLDMARQYDRLAARHGAEEPTSAARPKT